MNRDDPINVAVFIDYENVYKTLLAQRTNVLRSAFFEKLQKWCSENGRRVVRTVVYCNFDNIDLHESYHQSILQSYGVETVHTSNQGKNFADLKITIDVLTSMYSNDNIDEFFIMSNDKDMTPLLNTIRENKRNVTIITAGETYNPAICEFADHHITFEEICRTAVEHRVIDDLIDAYWKNFEEYSFTRMEKYRESGNYSHSSIDYVLKNDIKYWKIMRYELAAIIKEKYDSGEIFFYRSEYRGKPQDSFALSSAKQDLIDQKVLQERDILTCYDMQQKINAAYDAACIQT